MSEVRLMKVRDIHQHLLDVAGDQYPELVPIFQNHGPLFIPRRLSESLFLFLTRTVVKQELSAETVDSIWSRLLKVAEEESGTQADTFDKQFENEIRHSGLSEEQLKVLGHLRQLFLEGLIDEQRLHQGDYQMVRKVVTGLWGYGAWSADMTAIFYFGLPDIWSSQDNALQNGLKAMLSGDHRDDVASVPDAFAPFRSYLALHVWRYLDPQRAAIAN